MKHCVALAFCLATPWAGVGRAAAVTPADSARGAALFESLKCVECHSVNGKGGKIGPDLGTRLDRNFTPAGLAATMWNHAPAMWSAMRERNVRAGELSEQGAADLFAYFYSVRFFEQPGDAGRGKALFASKHCGDCHGLTQSKLPEAPPVSEWDSVDHPVNLVNAMWNHAGAMRAQFEQHKIKWEELSAQDLTDLLVYLRNYPGENKRQPGFAINAGENGKALYESKGCAACHASRRVDLAERLKNHNLTQIAAEMWNHEPQMQKEMKTASPPPLSRDEMREIVSYLWAGEFFRGGGNAVVGARVFTSLKCASCHNDPRSGAPKLRGSGRTFSATAMVAALWHHGPNMLEQMKSNQIAWPRFSSADMANLIAYLNTPDKRK